MENEVLIELKVPLDMVDDLRKLEQVEHIDRSTAVRKLLYSGLREWKLEHAATLYRDNRVTLARAAEEAGVPVREMMEYFRQKKVPMQYDMDDFEKDLKGIYERLGK
ncbi:MAG: UPF0175 family protein [Candidatus Aenigmarchaeota archaeon]|nr:UPF0175 family protein [Candidatus Aenigmarchaeota archaeon]